MGQQIIWEILIDVTILVLSSLTELSTEKTLHCHVFPRQHFLIQCQEGTKTNVKSVQS